MIAANDRGFTLGIGCFTTLTVKDNQAQYLSDHINIGFGII